MQELTVHLNSRPPPNPPTQNPGTHSPGDGGGCCQGTYIKTPSPPHTHASTYIRTHARGRCKRGGSDHGVTRSRTLTRAHTNAHRTLWRPSRHSPETPTYFFVSFLYFECYTNHATPKLQNSTERGNHGKSVGFHARPISSLD